MNQLNRRAFLKTSALAATTTAFSARSWAQVPGANSDIRLAVVGLNGRGRGHVRTFRRLPGVRVAVLCDADSAVLDRVAQPIRDEGDTVDTLVDFRDVLARDDIDAVSIATPNHLHSLFAIWACQAGKDVYVEKPVSHNVWEGRQLVNAVAQSGRIVQAGTQIRSSYGIAEAVEWVRAGHLGRITAAHGLCYKRRDSIGKTTGPQPVPETVDYNLWLGPALMEPPHRGRFHYDWHWIWAYGNGDLGNQGIHQMDVARWFLGESELAPHVLSVGGRFGYEDDGETPNTQVIVHGYEKAPLIFEVRGRPAMTDAEFARRRPPETENAENNRPRRAPMDQYYGASIGIVIHCEGGHVLVPSYTNARAFDQQGTLIKEWEGADDHFGNFIDCVRSRKQADLRGSILEGHVSSALCHTGNISHLVGSSVVGDKLRERINGDTAMADAFGRMAEHLAVHGVDLNKTKATLGLPLHLDPGTETFSGPGAKTANALLARNYREPFVVPTIKELSAV